MLNTVKGNMYSFVTHTWNTIKGRCPHDCLYCYTKRWGEQKPIRLDEKELKIQLGENKFIFVGSSCDMWADEIPDVWIDRTLNVCDCFKNKYLFQSKNPARFNTYAEYLPRKSVIGTTIETNRYYPEMGHAPKIIDRSEQMAVIRGCGFPLSLMITIEPIMDFDLKPMVKRISDIEPNWVNIGANTSSQVKLPEPAPEKVQELIFELEKITEVKIKKNMKRLWHNQPLETDGQKNGHRSA